MSRSTFRVLSSSVDVSPSPPSDTGNAASETIWDQLDEADRASIERGLAESLSGRHATDDEVAKAFALFDG